MNRKKILEKRMARLIEKRDKKVARSQEEDVTVEELRAIQQEVAELNEDIAEIQNEIDAIDEDMDNRDNLPNPLDLRGNPTPIAAFPQGQSEERSGLGSMEYRQAFMAYVQRGTPIPEDLLTRAGGDNGTTVAADIGAIIPETIMNEFIKEVSKVYGHIYAKVRKMNVKGGVKFPINKLKATFKWVTETTVSEKQKAGDIKDLIIFEYNIGEIRVAETLLAQVVSLPVFESEITRIMVEAYVEAMDKGIISGTGSGQLLGITKDSRVTNVVEMTEEDFSDWTAWRKNLFAKIPLAKRGQGEFLFPASTIESYLLTMKDANNQPIFREPNTASVEAGALAGRFFGRNVDFVEPDVIKDFATAAAGDVVGVYWVPQDYAINTNLQFGIRRYFDEDTNEWINKGLTIVDGKILDPTGCYLIKKKAAADKAAK